MRHKMLQMCYFFEFGISSITGCLTRESLCRCNVNPLTKSMANMIKY
uniref:Uncharacterized protein n=1 Tax=Rhizophora mucronata TaxID=61149 RepID=A0A2P2NZ30_RHIMU